MVRKEQIQYMTQIALIQKQACCGEEVICRYTRKDYIAAQVLMTWLISTAAYAILTFAVLVYLLGENPEVYISFDTISQSAFVWGGFYVSYCLFFCTISYIVSSNRYSKAQGWQIRFNRAVRMLEDYYKKETSEAEKQDWL